MTKQELALQLIELANTKKVIEVLTEMMAGHDSPEDTVRGFVSINLNSYLKEFLFDYYEDFISCFGSNKRAFINTAIDIALNS